MPDHPPLTLKVWGEYACFTRPEMKAERVSYDVMTPSAARGVLEAIYWKPEFRWRVRRITVLCPIRRASFLRNEVSDTISAPTVQRDFERGSGYTFYSDDSKNRTQRHTLALRDVAYLIEADVEPHGRGADDDAAKHRDIFRRRVKRGQCFHRPYLGCREFAAHFAEADGAETVPDELAGRTEPLGRMLFDLRYGGGTRNVPVFFGAELRDGVLHVPDRLYDEVHAPAEVHV